MKLTAGKLRYLMTVDGLQGSLPKVRCIDVAVQLGICTRFGLQDAFLTQP